MYLIHQFFISELWKSALNEWCNDYIYMHTYNGIISNNQSKDLITLWCLHVKSKAQSKAIYMQFPLFLLLVKNCGYFCHRYSHTPLHSTNDGLRKSRRVMAAVLIYVRRQL